MNGFQENPLDNGPTVPPEKQYTHPEIAELEADACSLVEKLKGKIDSNAYTLLLSDETGGRLPTLLIRKIIKKRHPDSKITTLFVNGGRIVRGVDLYYPAKRAQFVKHIRKYAGSLQRALITTQMVDTGRSVTVLKEILNDAGFNHIDIASVRSIEESTPFLESDIESLSESEIFVGREFANTLKFDSLNSKFSGVNNMGHSNVYPPSVRSNMSRTRSQKDEIQKTMNEARADIDLMAEHIYKKVWG